MKMRYIDNNTWYKVPLQSLVQKAEKTRKRNKKEGDIYPKPSNFFLLLKFIFLTSPLVFKPAKQRKKGIDYGKFVYNPDEMLLV